MRHRPSIRRGILTILGSALLGAGGVNAQSLGYVSQDRQVRVLAGNNGTPIEQTSGSLGVFEADLEDHYFDPNFGGSADVRMTQLSDLADSSITMSGLFSASASTDEFGSGASTLAATFDLAEASAYRLSFDLLGISFGESSGMSVRARLLDEFGGEIVSGVYDLGLGDTGDVALVDAGGVLGAGRYTVEFEVNASAFKGATNSGAFAGSFVVPAPACGFVLLGGLTARRRR